jgi:hypothetical protein
MIKASESLSITQMGIEKVAFEIKSEMEGYNRWRGRRKIISTRIKQECTLY